VPGLLLGADGVAVRPRGHERRVDGSGRRTDRDREVAAVAASRDIRNGRDFDRDRRFGLRSPRRYPRPDSARVGHEFADGGITRVKTKPHSKPGRSRWQE